MIFIEYQRVKQKESIVVVKRLFVIIKDIPTARCLGGYNPVRGVFTTKSPLI